MHLAAWEHSTGHALHISRPLPRSQRPDPFRSVTRGWTHLYACNGVRNQRWRCMHATGSASEVATPSATTKACNKLCNNLENAIYPHMGPFGDNRRSIGAEARPIPLCASPHSVHLPTPPRNFLVLSYPLLCPVCCAADVSTEPAALDGIDIAQEESEVWHSCRAPRICRAHLPA